MHEPGAAAADSHERFARLLEQHERGESVDWERACAGSSTLRELHGRWLRVEGVLAGLVHDPVALDAALTEALQPEAAVDAATRSRLERLAAPERARERYRWLGDVGRGGMGVVTRVFDHDLGRELALKTVRDTNARSLQRFLREARIAAQLEHPGILPVHDVGVDAEGRVFFTMPLVRGRTLTEVLELAREGREGWSLTALVEVVVKVCDALAFAHARGVVHRDVKPANILVGRFGEAYVTDWGLARRADEPDEPVTAGEDENAPLANAPLETARGAVLGTVNYMAPEQARGEMERISPRSDIYSLGAILFHALSGHMPHEGVDERLALERARRGQQRSLAELAPDAPDELVSICEKAMASEPVDRYRDCTAMAEDLRAFVAGRVVRAHERGALPEFRKWFARNRAVALLALLAVSGVVGGLGAALLVEARAGREILRLSDAQRLAALEDRARSLWPALPERVPELERWIADAQLLLANFSVHERALAKLRSQARENDLAQRFTFADAADQWRHDTLAQLVDALQRWRAPETERSLLSDVEARLAFARDIERESLVDAAPLWSEAVDAIANSPRYAGLRITPQLGLVPLGTDPVSGLWEFAHLASGAPPTRDVSGVLALQDASALVFVLVPAGEFAMGSVLPVQARDATPRVESGAESAAVDLLARADEGPVVRLQLPAFFVSKFELTWSQWKRIGGAVPRAVVLAGASARHPASTIAWDEAHDALARVALTLPTEAQWEYAARAGTTTRFWCGREAGSLNGRVNAGWGSDGLALHEGDRPAAIDVDRLAPNPWGLLHVAGNVAEWIEDEYAPDTFGPRRPSDGGRAANGSGLRLVRGGAFDSSPRDLRSAARRAVAAGARGADIGVRPARRIDP